MAKKSAFEYMAGQDEKVITSVNIKGTGICIKWKIPHEDSDDVTGTIKEVEPAHSDLLDKFKELREFCLTNVANKLTGDSRKAFIDKCHVYEIGFNTNTKGESAKIKATLGNGESQFSIIELPQTPFYSPDIEAHETGVVHTFGERLTKILQGIQMEAKMYLGGKRGEMQADMFEKGENVKAV